jgi:hypothetical protein
MWGPLADSEHRPGPRPVTYACPAGPGGHLVTVPLYVEAAVPPEWECVVHRKMAVLTDEAALTGAGAIIAELVHTQAKFSPKTHWQHIQARRTEHELEALLEERLALLRGRRSASSAA